MLEIMSRKLDSKDDYFQHLVFYYYYLNSIQIEFVMILLICGDIVFYFVAAAG